MRRFDVPTLASPFSLNATILNLCVVGKPKMTFSEICFKMASWTASWGIIVKAWRAPLQARMFPVASVWGYTFAPWQILGLSSPLTMECSASDPGAVKSVEYDALC